MCIPGLHLSLGIFQRLYNLFEEMNAELDLLIALELGTSATEPNLPIVTSNAEFLSALGKAKLYYRKVEEAEQMSEEADEMYSMICELLTRGSLAEDQYLEMMNAAGNKEEMAKKLVSLFSYK